MSLFLRRQTADERNEKPKVRRQTEWDPVWSLVTHHVSRIRLWLLLIPCFLLLLTGCEDNFQPIQNNSNSGVFSMFGYLDATADTQWVRVTPLRDQLNQTLVKPEMNVTLEHLQSGNISVLHDSLFNLRQGFYALTVWTTMDVEPEQTYRLRAEHPDGEASEVTVTIPPDFPTPILNTGGKYENSGFMLLKGLKKLADIVTVYKIGGEVSLIPYRDEANEGIFVPRGYDYSVYFETYLDIQELFDTPRPTVGSLLSRDDVRRQIFIASGGPEWLEEIISVRDEIYTLPEGVSNVENGVGYVIGIVSKTIPFTNCTDEQGEDIPCPLETPMF